MALTSSSMVWWQGHSSVPLSCGSIRGGSGEQDFWGKKRWPPHGIQGNMCRTITAQWTKTRFGHLKVLGSDPPAGVAVTSKVNESQLSSKSNFLAVWPSGMILASGVRGPGFNSQNSPCMGSRTHEPVQWRPRHNPLGHDCITPHSDTRSATS